jgi:hypothetical protein
VIISFSHKSRIAGTVICKKEILFVINLSNIPYFSLRNGNVSLTIHKLLTKLSPTAVNMIKLSSSSLSAGKSVA